jgi:hypothetical protein
VRRAVVLVGVLVTIAACGTEPGSAPPGSAPRPVSGAGTTPRPVAETVRGQVHDRAGAPVRGALVVPSPAGAGTPAVPEIAVLSDARGGWTWTLPPGSYAVVARLGDRVSEPVDLTVTAGRLSPTVELILPD